MLFIEIVQLIKYVWWKNIFQEIYPISDNENKVEKLQNLGDIYRKINA